MASLNDRRMATRALLARWKLGDSADCLAWDLEGPEGVGQSSRSDGRRLRITLGDLTLVHIGAGEGFAREGGRLRDLRAEEKARLERELRCNPFLWPRASIRERLADSPLLGGVHVHGRAGYRFAIAGAGECEAWLSLTGEPLGYTFRDPVRRAKVEYHVHPDQLYVVADGELEPGWRVVKAGEVPLDEDWFARRP